MMSLRNNPVRAIWLRAACMIVWWAQASVNADVLILTDQDAVRASDVRIAPDGAVTPIKPQPNSPPTLTLSKVRWMQFDVRDRYIQPAAWMCLQDGRRLCGDSLQWGPKQVTLKMPDGIVQTAPIADLAALFLHTDRPALDEAITAGVRILSTNGDVINAPAAELTDAGVVVELSADADPVVLPRERVAGLLWPARPMAVAGMVVELRTGERFIGQIDSLDDNSLHLKSANGAHSIARNDIRVIRPASVRVDRLDSLLSPAPPTGKLPAYRLNRNALGAPLRLGTKMYAHGVGLRGTAQIETAVPKEATWFIAQAGNDADAAAFARATLTILVDGQSQLELKDLAPSQPARSIAIRVKGTRTLTVRVAPASQPPTGCLGDLADAMFVN